MTCNMRYTIGYPLLAVVVIIIERAISFMVAGEIKVIIKVTDGSTTIMTGINWYQGNKSYSQVCSIYFGDSSTISGTTETSEMSLGNFED